MSLWCHRGPQTFKLSPQSMQLAWDLKFKRRLTWQRGCDEGALLSCIMGSVGSSLSWSLTRKLEQGLSNSALPRNLKEMFAPKKCSQLQKGCKWCVFRSVKGQFVSVALSSPLRLQLFMRSCREAPEMFFVDCETPPDFPSAERRGYDRLI